MIPRDDEEQRVSEMNIHFLPVAVQTQLAISKYKKNHSLIATAQG
jgi:hypothetical protein